MSRLRRGRRTPVSELQITAFMNMMVALVPFLLITAVFTHIAVLHLDLPRRQTAATDEVRPAQSPSVTLHASGLRLDRGDGSHLELSLLDGRLDLDALVAQLRSLKEDRPEEARITLRLEPQIVYDRLVRVMDVVRADAHGELFPEVAIGDAPMAAAVP